MPSSRRSPDSSSAEAPHLEDLPLVPVMDPPASGEGTQSAPRVRTQRPGLPNPSEEPRRTVANAVETESFEHTPVFGRQEEAPSPSGPRAEIGETGLPRLLFEEDDDDDEDITQVGKMSEQVKALRRGFRQTTPSEADHDRPDIEVHTEEMVDALLVEELLEDEPADRTRRISVVGHGASDRGRVRPINQDAVLLIPHRHTFLVADGMGGHRGGEVASALAAAAIEEAIESGELEGEPHLLWPQLGDELARAVEMANAAIFREATGDCEGMGTTVTAARFSANRQRAYIAHVGDSRCYRIREGVMDQLTEDHNLANLVGLEGPQGGHLSRAVGIEASVEVDLYVDVPRVRDRYLLCTDGLTKMLNDDEIAEVVSSTRNLARCVEVLVERANGRGGKDNIGIVIIQVYPPDAG